MPSNFHHIISGILTEGDGIYSRTGGAASRKYLFEYRSAGPIERGSNGAPRGANIDIYLLRGPDNIVKSLLDEGLLSELSRSSGLVFIIILDWMHPEYIYSELKTRLQTAEHCKKLYESCKCISYI